MRPDEYWASDAQRFTEAVMLRNAIHEGSEAARDEDYARKAAEQMARD